MRLAVALLVAAPLACTGEDHPPGPPPEAWCELELGIPVGVKRSLDLLFVVDRSPSMAEEQASLAAAWRRVMQVLETLPNGVPDVHIGVISSDVADDGLLQRGTCLTSPDPYLIDLEQPDGSRVRNYAGELGDTFACLAALGADGDVISAPLEASRRALDRRHSANDGFLRPDAALLIAILGDDDDCSAATAPSDLFACAQEGVICDGAELTSMPAAYDACGPRADGSLTSIEEYIDFVRSLKPTDPSQVYLTASFGPPSPFAVGTGLAVLPSCSSTTAEARPAVRLARFLEAFPNRNQRVSFCQGDLADLLLPIAESLAIVIGDPCLDGAVDLTDVHPEDPGLQLECSVALVSGDDEHVVVPCRLDADGLLDPTSARPCFWTPIDPTNCANTETQLTLRVEHAVWPPPGSHVVARCALEC